jgi:hypothetical protein
MFTDQEPAMSDKTTPPRLLRIKEVADTLAVFRQVRSLIGSTRT